MARWGRTESSQADSNEGADASATAPRSKCMVLFGLIVAGTLLVFNRAEAIALVLRNKLVS